MRQPDITKLSILVVDDVRAMRALMRTLLRNMDIQNVREASDGSEALELLRIEPFDLVLSDLVMQPMDGLEFTRRVRLPNAGVNPFMPIVMMSGHSEAGYIKRALAAGVTHFLAKPLNPLGVRRTLTEIVQSPRPDVKNRT